MSMTERGTWTLYGAGGSLPVLTRGPKVAMGVSLEVVSASVLEALVAERERCGEKDLTIKFLLEALTGTCAPPLPLRERAEG